MINFFSSIDADKKIKILAVINHMLLMYGLIYHFSWYGILIGYLLGYCYCLIGISIGYHRYFTHKAFKTSKFNEAVFVLLGSLTFLGPALGWVGIHRLHHATSDTDKDPHSPKNGFLKSWFHVFSNKTVKFSLVSDIVKNPILKFQYKYYFVFMTIFLIVSYWILGFYAVYLISLPAVYNYHITGIVNSVNHMKKDKKYNMNNNAVDFPILNILTVGESYHGFHHSKPNAAIFGRFDPARALIPIFER